MTELLKAMEDKMDENLKEMVAVMTASHKEMLAKVEAKQVRMMARMDYWLEKIEACLGKTEATNLDANPEEIESKAMHEEVPKEEAAVKPVKALKKWHGDRNLAIGRRQQPKKRSQGSGGFHKKLATACRLMTRRAGTAWHMGHCRQGQGQNSVARGASKGQTFGKKRRGQPECNNRIKD
jgi:hypothetical protein